MKLYSIQISAALSPTSRRKAWSFADRPVRQGRDGRFSRLARHRGPLGHRLRRLQAAVIIGKPKPLFSPHVRPV